MKLKRILSRLLAAVLILSLAACGGKTGSGTGTDAGNGSASGADSYSELLAGYTRKVAGLDPDEVLFTVNGDEVTAELYLYWLTYDCYYWDYLSYYYYGSGVDLTADPGDGTTYAEHFKDDAKGFCVYYMLLKQKAAEYGCGLTEEQKALWESETADFVETNGQDAFDLTLAQTGVNEELFNSINTYMYLFDNLRAKLISEPTEEDMLHYIDAHDVLRAKHILLQTAVEKDGKVVMSRTGEAAVNEDGTPFEGTVEEFNAKVLEKVNDLLDQLAAAEDTEALFDTLMKEYSQDPGLATNPDGYTFGAGEMVPEFEAATRALEYGAVSPAVKVDYGYHIVLRLMPDVAEGIKDEKFAALMEEWTAEAEIVMNGTLMEQIDTVDVYEKYQAYQLELENLPSGK